MAETFFAEVPGRVPFGGPDTTDPLAFMVYDPDRMVLGKRMEDHLRIGVCLWHSFAWPGSDVFGVGTFDRPWLAAGRRPAGRGPRTKLDAAFEFLEKLGVPFFCFHDRDVAPEARRRGSETRAILDAVVDADRRRTWPRTGVRLLWGTANLFGHPRYMAGAATNPDPEVFAYAAAQVKHMLEVTQAARRRELRPVGRPRGLRHPAEHGPRARGAASSPGSCTSSPSTSTRSGSRARC